MAVVVRAPIGYNMPMRRAKDLGRELTEGAAVAWVHAEEFLSSPTGRRVRNAAAAGLILAAPAIVRHPGTRATVVGRLFLFAGGAALLVKAADVIREWEPGQGAP